LSSGVAVIHGRFQPLHVGHAEYLLAGCELCEVLVVGITNPDPWLLGDEPTNPSRGRPDANPFTYYERYLMVEATLSEAGVPRQALRIVPFPHSYPERLRYYAPRDALYLLTIYDRWGEEKLHRFRDLGLDTRVMWRRDDKVTSGSEVRRRMRDGEPWRHLVPAATARVIESLSLDARVRTAVGGAPPATSKNHLPEGGS